MIIMTDPHGHYLTLRALLKKVEEKFPNEPKVLAGDLVDRGPSSADVVKLVMDEGIMCVKGNHEWFMIKSETQHYTKRDWMKSGGIETLQSYEGREDELADHRAFLSTLPLYLKFENEVNDDGRYLLVTHTGMYEPFAHWVNDPQNIWLHYKDDYGNVFKKHYDNAGVFNVHGHTVVSQPEVTRAWANIDTGCYVTWQKGYGRLTALRFPQMEFLFQENIDQVCYEEETPP